MTTLAFDTAPSFGAVAGVSGGRVASTPRAGDLLEVVDELVDDPTTIERVVVGRGPGSFTSIRSARAAPRSPALTLGVPLAGGRPLGAFERGVPVIDARRGEVFTVGPLVAR